MFKYLRRKVYPFQGFSDKDVVLRSPWPTPGPLRRAWRSSWIGRRVRVVIFRIESLWWRLTEPWRSYEALVDEVWEMEGDLIDLYHKLWDLEIEVERTNGHREMPDVFHVEVPR